MKKYVKFFPWLLLCYLLLPVKAIENLNAHQLSTLRNLRDYSGCRKTHISIKKENDFWIPWVCVKQDDCNKLWNMDDPKTYSSKFNNDPEPGHNVCRLREFNEDRDFCCFIGNLEEFSNVSNWLSYAISEENSYQQGIDEYKQKLFETGFNDPEIEEYAFRNLLICAIVPNGGKDGYILYTPYFCTAEKYCNTSVQGFKAPPQDFNFCQNNPHMPQPFIMQRSTTKMVCCPPFAVQIPPLYDVQTNVVWQFKAFPNYTKYAVGLRSSIQCELYSKNVCYGSNDMCPYRILFRDPWEAYPMEAYHQAMIGVKVARSQIFHCQGALVSRQFILSYDHCAEYEDEKTNIALVGDYRSDQIDEPYSHELFTYITEHHHQPPTLHETVIGFPKPSEYLDLFLMLYKLWRPVLLTPFRRPACINYQIPFDVPEWLKWGSSLFTGYGSSEKGGRWNGTVKRYIMQEIPATSPACYDAFFSDSDKTRLKECQIFCTIKLNKTYLDYYDHPPYEIGLGKSWGPCEFDLGGPLSRLLTVPYCQFLLRGLMIENRGRCDVVKPYKFRTVFSEVFWLEQQIYDEDFDLFDIDMSWPSCDRNNWQYINATYLHRDYNKFSIHRFTNINK